MDGSVSYATKNWSDGRWEDNVAYESRTSPSIKKKILKFLRILKKSLVWVGGGAFQLD